MKTLTFKIFLLVIVLVNSGCTVLEHNDTDKAAKTKETATQLLFTCIATNIDGEDISRRQAKSHDGFEIKIIPKYTELIIQYEHFTDKLPFRKQLVWAGDSFSENLKQEGLVYDMYSTSSEDYLEQYFIPSGEHSHSSSIFMVMQKFIHKFSTNKSYLLGFQCFNELSNRKDFIEYLKTEEGRKGLKNLD